MAYISWKPEMSVGIRLFDEEHKEQIYFINKLHDDYNSDTDISEMMRIFGELIECTKQHFTEEEALMQKHGFPQFINHAKEHSDLVIKVENFKHELISGKIHFTLELIRFFKDWLMIHIQGTDMKYKEFLTGKGEK